MQEKDPKYVQLPQDRSGNHCLHRTPQQNQSVIVHMTPSDILSLRSRITPKTKFVLTHIGAGEAPPEIAAAGIMIADDLTTITL